VQRCGGSLSSWRRGKLLSARRGPPAEAPKDCAGRAGRCLSQKLGGCRQAPYAETERKSKAARMPTDCCRIGDDYDLGTGMFAEFGVCRESEDIESARPRRHQADMPDGCRRLQVVIGGAGVFDNR